MANRPGELDMEDIAFRILIATQNSVKNLEELNRKIDEFNQRMAGAKKAQSNLNSSLSSTATSASRTNSEVKKLNNSIGETSQKTSHATKGLFSLTNVLRTALGTFEAMAIFLITKFVGDAIAKSIESLKQLEMSIYRIQQAEKTLSMQGMEVNFQDIQGIADRLTETYSFISDIDAQKLVGNIAGATSDLNLTLEQMEQLAQAVPVLAARKGISIDQAFQEVINGLTSSGKGWKDLWINVDAAIIKETAINEKLVESAEAFDNLTAEQKQQVEVLALLSILNKDVAGEMETIGENTTSTADQSRILSAEWENLTTVAGQVFKPIILALQYLMQGILTQSTRGFFTLGVAVTEFFGVIAGGISIMEGFADGTVKSVDQAVSAFVNGQEKVREVIYPNIFPTGIPSTLEGGIFSSSFFDKYKQKAEDTPTAPKAGDVNGAMIEEQGDLQKALEKMNNEILEAQIKLAQDMEDAAIDLGRKLVDIATEYARKRADAEKEYTNKVADINSSYREKVRDLNNKQAEEAQKARNDELEREAEFQNKMMELKENYLMDLEEALHERDARQVLRLMKQYNLDKLQAEREHALDQQSAARDLQEKKKQLARERADAENERKMKLAEAARDYQDKLAKLKADEDAERRAAELAYQRKMQDLQREMHNRLSLVAAGLVQEFNLTKKGLDAIYSLYKTYFGAISGMYSAMNLMLAGQSAISSATIAANKTYSAPTTGGGGRSTSTLAFAEGGTMLADKPTTVTFGEAGLEAATFTPISRNGRDVNKIFSNLGGEGQSGGNGLLEIDVNLSPDLEARVVKKSSDHMANVFTKVKNSKVR